MIEIKDRFVKYGVEHVLVKYDVLPFDRSVLKRRSVGVAMYELKSGSRLVGFNVERLKWDVTPFGDGTFKICNARIVNWGIDGWSCYTRVSADAKYSEVLEKLKSGSYDDEQVVLD